MKDDKKTPPAPKKEEKKESSETLAYYVGDEEDDVKTEVAKDIENFAYRKLGRHAGHKLVEAVDRKKKKPEKK